MWVYICLYPGNGKYHITRGGGLLSNHWPNINPVKPKPLKPNMSYQNFINFVYKASGMELKFKYLLLTLMEGIFSSTFHILFKLVKK